MKITKAKLQQIIKEEEEAMAKYKVKHNKGIGSASHFRVLYSKGGHIGKYGGLR